MDSSSYLAKSPFSPRSRQTLPNKRIMPAAFRKSSRCSVSGKSTQSVQIILKSQFNYVERFGQPLPVLITEALTFVDRNVVVTANISECGYAWVICGRRLLIWQYRQSPGQVGTPQRKHGLTNQCFELQLPQSDLAHRAELVAVFYNGTNSTPSCIAVSPEGLVRYWPSIAHENVTVEQVVDLQGQECDNLKNIDSLGCILATTTCTVVLVQPTLQSGRHILNCKTLRTSSGWLGGISKRMSSLIFGPVSSHSNETRIVRVLSIPTRHKWDVFVVAGHSLQKWSLSLQEPEQLVYVAELNRIIRDSFHGSVWDNCVGDQAEIDTWLLDVQTDKDSLLILTAAVNVQMSPQVHYALISVVVKGNQPPTSIKDFFLLKMTGLYREDNPSDSLSYRFLLCGTYAYLYNQRAITVIKPQEAPDVLEFTSPQDFLLGGSVCVNTPIFFSRNNGLVAVSSNEFSSADLNLSLNMSTGAVLDTSLDTTAAPSNLSLYQLDVEDVASDKDVLGQLKAALIHYVHKQKGAYEEIVNELFPLEAPLVLSEDSVLDKTIVQMCQGLLDDVPSGDPRWNSDAGVGIGSSYSMQVLNQLEDKQKAIMLVLRFLKEAGLWERLGSCMIRGSSIATVHIFGEFCEKLVAAIALKSLPNNMLLENAYEQAIKDYDTEQGNGLTNQDIFYKDVSKIHKGIQELVNCCEDGAHSDLGPSQVTQMVHDTNEIILNVLNEVIQYRKQQSETFTPSETVQSIDIEYLPWTAANGPEGLLDSLLLQHNLTYNYGIKLAGAGQQRNAILDHFVALTDVILDGRKSHIESLRNNSKESVLYKQYCNDRHKLIKPLLQEKDFERAAQLAEKYLDFESLVLICESTDNESRLDEYMIRFSSDGFSEYAYNWFLKENQQGKLIDRYRKSQKKDLQKLTNFLSDHPSLSWMQQVFDRKFSLAGNTLVRLAEQETESITRQKTMFSLAKLAKLAGPGNVNQDIENIDAHLELVGFQEELPDYVLQQFGYDTLNPKVIAPKDLIHLFICPEYIEAAELEYKKALEVLNFIEDDEEREELRLKIWRSAILRDSWDYKNLDSPIEILQNLLFFKIVDLAVTLGADVNSLLPPLDMLVEGLKSLQDNKSFQYLIKTGYEYIFKS